jgi:hypothetical protein
MSPADDGRKSFRLRALSKEQIMCDTHLSWVQLVGTIGIGAIVAAVLGWGGIKAVAISNHRQAWINALRDDLVSFMKEVDVLRFLVPKLLRDGDPPDLQRQQDARNAALLAYRRVLMRLNMTETLHVNLADLLKDVVTTNLVNADERKVDEIVRASRLVLKYEWAVTKYGIVSKPVLAFKAWRKKPCSG